MDRSQLKYLLKKYNIQPRRENGQNFLVSDRVVNKLITSAELKADDFVLEIGSGLGALTSELVKQAKKVVAVEMDKDFMPILNNLAKANKNLEIINQDVLKINFDKLNFNNFKLISNLPFNITSLVFRNFLEKGPRPELMSVLIQKEVAERIVAKPGQMSLLSISVQLYGETKIEQIVSRNHFYPSPDVDCAILSVKNIQEPANISDNKAFFKILRIAFSAKRKKLTNNLANGLNITKAETEEHLRKLDISVNTRAQELSVSEWGMVFDHFKRFVI